MECDDRSVGSGKGPKKRLLGGLALGLTLVGASAGSAWIDDNQVLRIEEDWELRLNDPGPELDAPQFHTIMSPTGNLNSYYFQVCWNYRDNPDFMSGGLQLHAWNGDSEVGSRADRDDQLSTTAETVNWTQQLKISGSSMTFMILNGRSTTWGSFGGSDSKLTGPSNVSSLNSYSPDISARQSWISFGANRVNQLRIKQIRYYNQDGDLVALDDNSRVIYQGGGGSSTRGGD